MIWLREAFWKLLFLWVQRDFTITLPGDPVVEPCTRRVWPRMVALCMMTGLVVTALSFASYYAWMYGSWRR